MIDVIPGIQEKTWEGVEAKLQLVTPYVEWVQIDITDSTMLPYSTFLEFAKLKPYADKISFEAHLMVDMPEKYIQTLADNGFKRLIAHVESHDPRLFLDQCKHEHVEVGIAIDGPTEFEQVEPFLEEVDCVLVMTYEIGPSGRAIMPETFEKIKSIRSYLPDLPIEVDGGINEQTARLVKESGATRLVSTNYVFKDPANIAAAIEHLKNA